jgi:hypothetical protein
MLARACLLETAVINNCYCNFLPISSVPVSHCKLELWTPDFLSKMCVVLRDHDIEY